MGCYGNYEEFYVKTRSQNFQQDPKNGLANYEHKFKHKEMLEQTKAQAVPPLHSGRPQQPMRELAAPPPHSKDLSSPWRHQGPLTPPAVPPWANGSLSNPFLLPRGPQQAMRAQ